jgi:NAD(P)-dependent dehydrogenase (short-subunit alcohol dehydrogenase family)
MSDFSEASVPDQSGRTILVTGANTGIGYDAARVLAGCGARVLLGCRSAEKAGAARDRIRGLHAKADVEVLSLDLGSLASVREAAAEALREERIDLLINNAGIMAPPREETVDGFESQFGVNHLGHFALTGLLLPKLLETEGSRVVNVSSSAHKFGTMNFDDLQSQKSYSRQGSYGQSKLANILFTNELQRRLSARGASTLSVACHPGISDTELSRHFPAWVSLLFLPMRLMTQSSAMGALPTLIAATGPDVRGGDYYGPGKRFEMVGPPNRQKASAEAQDESVARRLWDVSVELTEDGPRLAVQHFAAQHQFHPRSRSLQQLPPREVGGRVDRGVLAQVVDRDAPLIGQGQQHDSPRPLAVRVLDQFPDDSGVGILRGVQPHGRDHHRDSGDGNGHSSRQLHAERE